MLSTVQFRLVGALSWPGSILMMIEVALASSSSLSWEPSGTTVIMPPTESKSAGVIGWFEP